MEDMVQQTWLDRHGDLVVAIGSVVLAVIVAWLAHRAIERRGRQIAARVAGGELSPVADTRLRFLRRTTDAGIVLIGLLVALSQFTAVDRLAGTVLASSAIVAAVVGFAARQTLANAIAGFMLAITQPMRIGDVVTFEQETGVVEDVRLTYTWIRTPGGTRVIVPNERLAAGVLRNDSIADPDAAVDVFLWLHRDVDPLAAMERMREGLGDVDVALAETSSEGSRIALTGARVPATRRAAARDALRERALGLSRPPGGQAAAS